MKHTSVLLLVLISTWALAQSDPPCPLLSVITVDGKADEWNMNWVADDDKKFFFNVCADDQNLFVRVKSSDFYVKRKMGAFGFTLWFDPAGKKKKNYGLKFPSGGAEGQDRINELQAEGAGKTVGERTDFQKKADRIMITNLEVMELIGLADDPITSTRSGITNGIKVAIDLDATTGDYVYEAVIPFKSYRLSKANIKELSVGFETGRYIAPKQKPTTKNAPQAGADLNPQQLSRLQGYNNRQGNPELVHSTSAWTKLVINK